SASSLTTVDCSAGTAGSSRADLKRESSCEPSRPDKRSNSTADSIGQPWQIVLGGAIELLREEAGQAAAVLVAFRVLEFVCPTGPPVTFLGARVGIVHFVGVFEGNEFVALAMTEVQRDTHFGQTIEGVDVRSPEAAVEPQNQAVDVDQALAPAARRPG